MHTHVTSNPPKPPLMPVLMLMNRDEPWLTDRHAAKRADNFTHWSALFVIELHAMRLLGIRSSTGLDAGASYATHISPNASAPWLDQS